MRAVLARVTRAQVSVEGECLGSIGPGVLALVAAHRDDTAEQASLMARKIAELRIMRDERSVTDSGGAILLVSQFTLYGQTRKGRRPSWSDAARGEHAEALVDHVRDELRARGLTVETGRFGADMAVESVNDGPFTVIVDT